MICIIYSNFKNILNIKGYFQLNSNNNKNIVKIPQIKDVVCLKFAFKSFFFKKILEIFTSSIYGVRHKFTSPLISIFLSLSASLSFCKHTHIYIYTCIYECDTIVLQVVKTSFIFFILNNDRKKHIVLHFAFYSKLI